MKLSLKNKKIYLIFVILFVLLIFILVKTYQPLDPISFPSEKIVNTHTSYFIYALDVGDISNYNRFFSENNIPKKLPIYIQENFSKSRQNSLAYETAEKIGFTVEDSLYTTDHVQLQCDQGTITVNITGTIEIVYNGDWNESTAVTGDQLENYYDNITDICQTIKNFSKPQRIFESWYYDNGKFGFRIGFFDETGSVEKQMINYYSNKVIAQINTNRIARLTISNMSGIIDKGNYPIISLKEAKSLLLEKRTLSFSQLANNYNIELNDSSFERVDLQYLPIQQEIFQIDPAIDSLILPYYRFYVRIPEQYNNNDGLKSYLCVDVLAIDLKYLIK